MPYSVKEIFYTLQGEGFYTGRPSVFVRFSGCNLWSGREEDRATAICTFCDTDFRGTDGPGGGRFDNAEALVRRIRLAWPTEPLSKPYVVFTGGEPLLQLDEALTKRLHEEGFEIGIETNGTLLPPDGVDWICVSPKAGAEPALKKGNELKLIYPQKNVDPVYYLQFDFQHFYLQPMDGPDIAANTRGAIDYCLAHPRWKLSLQTHKIIGIP